MIEAAAPSHSLITQLLEALHKHELASRACRQAIARYCDAVEKADGGLYLKTLDLTSQVEELVNQAIEDLEARTLARVSR